MRSMKTVIGILGALVPVVYCGWLLTYFLNVGGTADGVVGIGLGPTVLGLGAIGLLLCIPLLFKIMKAVTGSGRKAEKGSGAEAQTAASDSEPEPSFDADAALARYMAKKASGLVEAPPVEPGVRPAFGRKGI